MNSINKPKTIPPHEIVFKNGELFLVNKFTNFEEGYEYIKGLFRLSTQEEILTNKLDSQGFFLIAKKHDSNLKFEETIENFLGNNSIKKDKDLKIVKVIHGENISYLFYVQKGKLYDNSLVKPDFQDYINNILKK